MILFHLLLPVLGIISNWFIISWVYLVILDFLLKFNTKTKVQHLWFVCYVSSFEILARVLNCTPFIPYEFSKYFIIGYSVILIFKYSISITPAFLGIGTVLVSILLYGFDLQSYTFNAMGPISLIFLATAFRKTIVRNPFTILRLLLLPLISLWFYCLFNTPNISELDYSFSSNDLLTGGFGTNQVATVFGAACLILYLFIFFGIRFTPFLLGDIILLLLILVQGLLSFSRGGIIGFFAAGLVFSIIFLFRSGRISKLVYLGLGLVMVVIGFVYVNNLTGNQLFSRYQGETYGVQMGAKENDLNNLTTNRLDIFMADIELWKSDFLFGIGIGNSRLARTYDTGNVAHTELSRLLAEQGLLGLMFFIQWMYLGWFGFVKNRSTMGKSLVATFFFLAVFSSFHAAMRTYITPVFTALSVIFFLPEMSARSHRKISTKNYVRNNRLVPESTIGFK